MASDGNDDSKKVGHYELLSELHKGTLGALWLGQSTSGDDEGALVAIRRVELAGEVDEDALKSLEDCNEVASGLSHPNILKVIEVVRKDAELAIVSEYQHAETVRSMMRLAGIGRKPAPPGVVARIALDVLEACVLIQDAGSLASVHPDNVFIGSDGVTRLGEPVYSHAAALQPAWKQQPKRATYSAPEQLGDEPGDATSDVFSVGVLMWELLRNRPLFGGSNFDQVAERVRSAAIGRADALKPAGGVAVPKGLADAVEKALSRQPAGRFSSAVEMLEALEALEPADHADVAKYAKEVLADAFATLDRKVGAAKPKAAAPAARPAPPQKPAPKAAAAPAKPQLPPRVPKATMQIDSADLISLAPTSTSRPDDEAGDELDGPPSEVEPPAPAKGPARVARRAAAQAEEPPEEAAAEPPASPAPRASRGPVKGRAGARGRDAKKTLIGMAAPSSRPADLDSLDDHEAAQDLEAAHDDEVDFSGSQDGAPDLASNEQYEEAPRRPRSSTEGGGFDVMSIADDPSDPDGMDEQAAAALERLRSAQSARPAPRSARPAEFAVSDAPSAQGRGKLIAIAGVAIVVVAGAAFALLGRSKDDAGGKSEPSATAAAVAAPTSSSATTAAATAEAAPTASAAPAPSASESAPPVESAVPVESAAPAETAAPAPPPAQTPPPAAQAAPPPPSVGASTAKSPAAFNPYGAPPPKAPPPPPPPKKVFVPYDL